MGISVGGDTPYVRLYYDGDVVFQTANNGAMVLDGDAFYAGDGGDLKLWHNGSSTQIDNKTGTLLIREQVNSGLIKIQSFNSVGVVKDGIRVEGATPYVGLYYDGAEVFRTISGGVQIDPGITINAPSTNSMITFHRTDTALNDVTLTLTGSSGGALTFNVAGSKIVQIASGGMTFGTDRSIGHAEKGIITFKTRHISAPIMQPAPTTSILSVSTRPTM